MEHEDTDQGWASASLVTPGINSHREISESKYYKYRENLCIAKYLKQNIAKIINYKYRENQYIAKYLNQNTGNRSILISRLNHSKGTQSNERVGDEGRKSADCHRQCVDPATGQFTKPIRTPITNTNIQTGRNTCRGPNAPTKKHPQTQHTINDTNMTKTSRVYAGTQKGKTSTATVSGGLRGGRGGRTPRHGGVEGAVPELEADHPPEPGHLALRQRVARAQGNAVGGEGGAETVRWGINEFSWMEILGEGKKNESGWRGTEDFPPSPPPLPPGVNNSGG